MTGSRLRSRGEVEPSPVTVFDRKKIEELGVTSLPDLLRYTPQQPFLPAETNNFAGQQFFQLRGLPTGTTAVLLNGRRLALSARDQNSNALDLNMIPLAAIERVEILSDSASAMYGADAIGGVMNIILKKDITRPVMEMRYGGARDGAQERRLSLTAGFSADRFRGGLLADYFDKDPLSGADRDRWADQDYRRFGGTDRRVATANPGTVATTSGANLTGLSSPFAFAPRGTSGVGLTPANFNAVPNLAALNSVSRSRYEEIVLDQSSRSGLGFVELDLTNSVTLFGEGFYTDSKLIDRFRPPTATLNVPANNPFNPFNQALTVRYLFAGLGEGRSDFQQDMFSATAGAKGRLASWDWEVSAQRSQSTSDAVQFQNNAVVTALANCVLSPLANRPLSCADRTTEVLNVFQDGPGASPALLASLVSPPTVSEGRTDATQITAFLRGKVFDLPAGGVEMVAGASSGAEENELLQTAPTLSALSGDRDSYAGFFETKVPLVSPAMHVAAVNDLFLKLAARYDHYSDFGATFNPQFGLVWAPVAGLSLTASYGTSFAPPSFFNLYRPLVAGSTQTLTDPKRNESATFTTSTGGNPDLDPQEGESFSYGNSLRSCAVAGSSWVRALLERRPYGLHHLALACADPRQ